MAWGPKYRIVAIAASILGTFRPPKQRSKSLRIELSMASQIAGIIDRVV